MPVEIYTTPQCDTWPDNITPVIDRAVNATLNTLQYTKDCGISVVLADDAFVRDLNHRYRNQDKPTNVLSFPQDDDTPEEVINLGDVIFALETIQKEATEQKKDFKDHLSHLIVHGTLHLMGFDHIDDHEAEEMEDLEIRILQNLNILNPYQSIQA